MKKIGVSILFLLMVLPSWASSILIPMDKEQANHLKAYGIAYWILSKGVEVDWLLNYRGGCFLFENNTTFAHECVIRGVTYSVISDAQAAQIVAEIGRPDVNQDVMRLEKPPKIAVYSPKSKQPWDDAVTLAMTYAEIPYEVVFDEELLNDELPKYDWLHLHHEDFTGQYGKFWASFRDRPWYKQQVKEYEEISAKYGFKKVSEMKLAVVKKIRDYVASGGFMFAMCSATDTYDIALSADGVDICADMFDGDPIDKNAQKKIDYSKTFAFKDFRIVTDPYDYEYSNIDNRPSERPGLHEKNDFFDLFTFSAKWDPIPTMLSQNHEIQIRGFMGQTTGFKMPLIKSDVLIMGETKRINEAKYIHGTFGQGTWTFYGGHDPEDYQHQVEEEPTDLNLHPNSPGYRLILNNVLFPAARKKKQKT